MIKRFINKSDKGFTLIELLIVIAVLGVLAAAVLAALNPIEQINRGKDAGRISSVGQLGHAMQSYFTSQTLSAYPAVSATWQTTLKGAGELQNVITAPVAGAGNCLAANNQNNFCYAPATITTANDNAVIWTILDAAANKTKANNCATVVAAVWSSYQGKTGIDCLATVGTVPGASDTLY